MRQQKWVTEKFGPLRPSHVLGAPRLLSLLQQPKSSASNSSGPNAPSSDKQIILEDHSFASSSTAACPSERKRS